MIWPRGRRSASSRASRRCWARSRSWSKNRRTRGADERAASAPAFGRRAQGDVRHGRGDRRLHDGRVGGRVAHGGRARRWWRSGAAAVRGGFGQAGLPRHRVADGDRAGPERDGDRPADRCAGRDRRPRGGGGAGRGVRGLRRGGDRAGARGRRRERRSGGDSGRGGLAPRGAAGRCPGRCRCRCAQRALADLRALARVSRDGRADAAPGEFRRLARALKIAHDPTDTAQRPLAAEALAQRLGCVVVLKGAGTVVSDGQRTWVCPHGHPCLATAGTGDVLSGVIAGLVAQWVRPPDPMLAKLPEQARRALGGASAGGGDATLDLFDAARAGVVVHALAGERWAAAHDASAGLLAAELAALVPECRVDPWWMRVRVRARVRDRSDRRVWPPGVTGRSCVL
ncbi:MAG: hypothetical protein HND58_03690 [Planctomycetota bacterium]|nr:MAG: hypothetical protein HND58_03690 [Planctomycetota bacterium]